MIAVRNFLLVKVSLNGTKVGVRRSRAETEKLNQQYGSSDLYDVKEHTIPKSIADYVKEPLRKAATLFYSETQEWGSIGRVIPAPRFMEFAQEIDKLKVELHNRAVDRFDTNYDATREAARLAAGAQWDPSNFPLRGELVDRFDIGLDFQPLTAADTFALEGLDQHAVESLRAEMEERHMRNFEAYIQAEVEETLEGLRTAEEGLAEGSQRTRYGSLIGKAKRQAERIRRMNPTGDARLTKLAETLEGLYEGVDGQTLKDSKADRGKVRDRVKDAIDTDWLGTACGKSTEEEENPSDNVPFAPDVFDPFAVADEEPTPEPTPDPLGTLDAEMEDIFAIL